MTPPHTPFAPALDKQAVAQLSKTCGLPFLLCRLLWNRGLRSGDDILLFLQPTLAQLHDPYCMQGMAAAVDRLRAALSASEPILIYGDYDVDGTVATVLLKTALERAATSLGVTADVRYHIPHRIREGYGIRESRIADAAAEGVRLVVSVDTGIRAFAAADEAARVGLDLIVTDHHLPDSSAGIPAAVAVLNPNQPGCPYPYKELCGAAVAFKLAQAVLESSARDQAERLRLREKTLPSFLKLLAIATVADAVPLTGENRVIAALGLLALRNPAQSGLRSLMELAGIDLSRPLSAHDVGFRLGPRINAAGRMDVASDVVELFLARDPALARSLAEKLHALNDDRRTTEARALEEIEARLAGLDHADPVHCHVLDDTPAAPWHRGVIGILASRVVERTGRPALVLTHENGEAHGSGRSVAGFHLLDALTAAHAAEPGQPLFLRFGGHAHAAGFALPSDRVALLRDRMQGHAAAADFSVQDAGPLCEAEIDLSELTVPFLEAYERLSPFGHGHPEPLFRFQKLQLAAAPRIIKECHLGLQLRADNEGRVWRATAWSRRVQWAERAQAEGWCIGTSLDLVARLHRNWHPDFGGWELEILTASSSSSSSSSQ